MEGKALAEVGKVLGEAGDPAAALLFVQACRQLDEGLRIAIVSREAPLATRLARRLEAMDATWVPFGFAPPEDPSEGAWQHEDRLLGVHAVIWATALPAALGVEERHALERLEVLGAPAVRVCVLVDAQLIGRIADEPEREMAEVTGRIDAILPPGWERLDEDGIAGWISGLHAGLPDLRRERRTAVARLLFDEALRTRRDEVTREDIALATISDLLAREDEALAKALQEGQRVARHLLGAMKRHLEAMRAEFRSFLARLDLDLGPQLASIEDVDVLRRVVPHWLNHVVETQLSDRLAGWRVAVLKDLAEIGIGAEQATNAELLVPALHPAPLRGESGWSQRLGVSLAIGGGAAMLLMGLWLPGAAALSGGLLWSAFGRESRDERTRERLLESARAALRRMGEDVETLLGDQLTQIEGDLEKMGEDRAKEAEAGRAEIRARLMERRGFHRSRADAARELVARLEGGLGMVQ